MKLSMFRKAVCVSWFTLIGVFFHASASGAPAKPDVPRTRNANAAATLVIYNKTDRDSIDLARFYAGQRGIPNEQLLGLKCSTKEEIAREEYDRDIAEPVRRAFTENKWWKLRENEPGQVETNKIRFVVLMRGIPLKIVAVMDYAGDKPAGPPPLGTRNEASVDSELAALAIVGRGISGALNNPYFRSEMRFADAKLPGILLVCRLDAATPMTVRRMITDSIAAEQTGLRGFAYVDARGLKDGGLVEGDKWLLTVASDARRLGTPVILDNGEGVFPVSYPMRYAALYFGWYTENVAGPMANPNFRFRPGAVVAHIHSFSAATLREPRRYWAGPLLEAGAAATLGNVYEPYLSLTPNLDIFHARLRAGFTFAESAWSAERVLSWMTTFIGDPLYQPFQTEVAQGDRRPATEWEAFAAGAKLWFEDQSKGRQQLIEQGKKWRSGVVMEGLGLLELAADQPDAAIKSFGVARDLYKNPEDILRVTIHEVIQLRARARDGIALALIRKQLEIYGKSPAAEVLRTFEREMAPPAAPGGPPPKQG